MKIGDKVRYKINGHIGIIVEIGILIGVDFSIIPGQFHNKY